MRTLDRLKAASRMERETLARAYAGVMSLPVAEDSAAVKRKPVLLTQIARIPAVWVAMLRDAMIRSGKGDRKPSQRRTATDDRRADKIGTTKLERRLRQPTVAHHA